MGVAIERYVSVHKILAGIKSGDYLDVDIDTLYKDDSLESTQESANFEDEKVLLLTYYGLVQESTLVQSKKIFWTLK